jgi:hypothetical protein
MESLGEALQHLGQDLGDLFRAELALFKKEATAQVRPLVFAGVWVAAGAVMGLAFLGAFTAFLILVLTLVFQAWLAALIVTIAWGVVAAGLMAAALVKFKSAMPLEFDETTRSVKEDVEWIKSGLKAGK